MYQVELVWNREFDFVRYGNPKDTIEQAKALGDEILYSGDGARVKKYRVVNEDGEIVYPKQNK